MSDFTDENIPKNNIWKLENIDSSELLPYLNTLENEKKYVLNIQNKEKFDLFENCVYKMASSIFENLYMNKHHIEFYNYSKNNLDIEYNKKTKKSPLKSSLLILSEPKNHLLFTNFDIDQYKYKEIPDENYFNIVLCEKNNFISFDSSKYFGFYKSNKYEKNPICLIVNIWDIELSNNILYESNETAFIKTIESKNIIMNTCDKIVINESFTEKILYNYDENNYEINDLIFNHNKIEEIQKDNNIITIKNFIKCNHNEDFLINKYGEISKQIIPFLNNDDNELEETNIFYKNTIIQKTLSTDVCYWIINECEKHNKWEISKYENYPNYLNLELLPHVFSFIHYLLNGLTTQIRKIYNFENVFNIKITDLFITRYEKSDYSNIKMKDNSFLTLNIQLNDKLDYIRGDIFFNEENSITIEQGDMLIFNGKRKRTRGAVTDGVKYVLVIMIDFKL